MKIDAEDVEVVSTYIEDGELNVLIGTCKKCPFDVRWTLVLDPVSGAVKSFNRCLASDDGLTEF